MSAGSGGLVPESALTGLRGIAALWVALCHAWYHFGTPRLDWLGHDFTRYLSEGWIGVIVFFVLSGYLLAPGFVKWRAHAGARPATSSYLYRRITRVFPAYYAQLLILVVAFVLVNHRWPFDVWQLLGHLLMQFPGLSTPVSPLNGVWWTLPVEFAFYLALPLLAWLIVPGRPLVIALVGLSITLAYHLIGKFLFDEIQVLAVFCRQFPGYLVLFCIGMAAAQWRMQVLQGSGQHHLKIPTWPWLLGLIVLIEWLPLEDGGAQFWTGWTHFLAWKPLAGLMVAGVILSLHDARSLSAGFLASAPMVYLGQISYSYYLWHLPVFLAWSELQGTGWWQLDWSIALLLTGCVAALSERYVERPWMQRRVDRMSAVA